MDDTHACKLRTRFSPELMIMGVSFYDSTPRDDEHREDRAYLAVLLSQQSIHPITGEAVQC